MGGLGVSQKVILHDEGRRGDQTPPKKDDIIYEQPLRDSCCVPRPAGLPSHVRISQASLCCVFVTVCFVSVWVCVTLIVKWSQETNIGLLSEKCISDNFVK